MSNFYIDTTGMEEKLQRGFEDFKKNVKAPNILVVGQTGVGKSSLINAIFGKDLAKVSDVKPETRGFHLYHEENTPVNIIDSEGYELEKSAEFLAGLKDYIDLSYRNPEEQIHLAWYCVSTPSARIFSYDIENIKFIKEQKIPVAVVFTKCDLDDPNGSIAQAMREIINSNFNGNVKCFETSNDEELNKELDIQKLTQWSIDNISDENLKKGFIIAQKADLEKKDEIARGRVKYYAGVAAGIGGSPIPMSDAVLLTTLQITMAADIFSIYGLNNSLSNTAKSFVQSKVVSMLGKMIAGNLVKLIPGIGNFAGPAINATVAATITYSMGYALCRLAKKAIEEGIEGNEFAENILTEDNLNKFFEEGIKEAPNQ